MTFINVSLLGENLVRYLFNQVQWRP